MKRLGILLLSTLVWLPCLHLVYARRADPGPLLSRQLALLDRPLLGERERAPARASNPEWDLMGRSFVAWALANWALREPAHTDEALRGIDAALRGMLDVEARSGFRGFLLPYARGRFQQAPDRSLFVDSEIALTAALRRLVRDDSPDWQALSRERARAIAARIRASPLGLVESYPDEGWSFDHGVGLAALVAVDRLDASDRIGQAPRHSLGAGISPRSARLADHSREIERVLVAMKRVLVDPGSGLLASSFTPQGRIHDGPEGSSLWMTLHCLSLVDEPFAREQYRRARAALGASFLGFGWAREWPRGHRGEIDIDSGPVVPLLDVSAGSSGLAFVGAAAFGDQAYLRQLNATLEMAAFPLHDALGKKYGAANQVGDAVLLYAWELGPAWEKLRQMEARR
jgi:hypothetical protein